MNIVALRRVVLLLSGLGFLCIEAEIPIQPSFDPEKFSGQWYPISAVSKGGKEEANYHYPAPVFKGKAKEKLRWSIDFPVLGTKCKKKTFYLQEVDKPGKYKARNENIYRIVETDYSSYFIFHREAKKFPFLGLFARTKEASDEVKEKFKKSAKSLGFPLDKIVPIRLQECKEPKEYVN